MNTFIKLFIIIVFFLTGFYGCTDDTVGPVPENNYQYGWVAGDLDSNSYGTILYTSNGGENWLTRNNSVFLKNVSVVDICAIDKNTVFAVCDSNRILKSLDGGNNWIKLNTPDLNPVPGLACISALNSNTIWVSGEQGTVYKTIDGGNTWIQQGIGFFPAISMQGIRVINANVVYCVGNQGEGIGFAYCSKNGGSAWDTVAMPLNFRMKWIGARGLDTNNVYIYGEHGNYIYTSDAGITWTGYVAPSSWGDINSMTMFDNNIFWLACDYDNILFTTNAGANWSVKKPPQYGNEFLVGSYSIDRQTVYMVGQSAGYPTAGRILQSIDGGNNWTLQYSGNVNLYKISFAK